VRVHLAPEGRDVVALHSPRMVTVYPSSSEMPLDRVSADK
jgi:hypothetical protein